MKKSVLGFLVLIVLLCACSSDNAPNSGISTNPNFIKGTIKLADQSIVSGAVVALINSDDIRKGMTDTIGAYAIEVDPITIYAMEVIYADSVIYSNNTVSIQKTPNIDVIIEDEKIIEYVKSVNSFNPNDSLKDSTLTLYKSITLNNENCEIDDSYITMHIDSIPKDSSSTYENIIFGNRFYFVCGLFDTNTRMRGLIKFGLDSLDDATTIDSAFLVLKKEAELEKDDKISPELVITAYPLLLSWNEGTLAPIDSATTYSAYTEYIPNTSEYNGVTSSQRYWGENWGTIGVGTDGKDADSIGFSSVPKNLEELTTVKIDITDIVNRWNSGDLENNGVLLVNENEYDLTYYNYPVFYSSEAIGAENSPELQVHYSVTE